MSGGNGRVRDHVRGRPGDDGDDDEVAPTMTSGDVLHPWRAEEEVLMTVLSTDGDDGPATADARLLPELVAHLRQHRTTLREEWASRINSAHLLQAMTPQEIVSET